VGLGEAGPVDGADEALLARAAAFPKDGSRARRAAGAAAVLAIGAIGFVATTAMTAALGATTLM